MIFNPDFNHTAVSFQLRLGLKHADMTGNPVVTFSFAAKAQAVGDFP